MFYRHLILDNNGEKVLYLYLDYSYEFSEEFDRKNRKEKSRSIYQKVIEYLKNKKINFNGTKVFLVVNGIIISALMLSNYPYQELASEVTPKYQYVEYIKDFNKPNIDTNEQKKDVSPTNQTEEKKVVTANETPTKKTVTDNNSVVNNKPSIPTKTTTESPLVPADNPPPVPPPPSPPPTPPSPPPTPPTPPPVVSTERTVTLYRSTGVVETIPLEDYLVGVVAAEMPASFQNEALKAQSVTARTYTLKRINEGKVLTDTDVNQVYKDIGQLKAYWGGSYDTYYNKVKQAVLSTKGEYIAYNGKYIDAVYHSTNNGKTESSLDVWGNYYPYLVSVDSHWDIDATSYYRETVKDISLINTILGLNLNNETNIQVLSRTDNNSVATMQIDGNTYTGIQLRELLGLRSTDFDIKIEESNVVFITRGYGHGVGMSQYGSNGMAKEGYNYKDILIHYYPGTNINKLS